MNFVGTSGNDTFGGTPQNDTARGGVGNDSLWGNDGDDTLNGDNNQDRLHGGAGNDFLQGGLGGDLLIGDNGNDTLYGQTGVDLLYGGDGDDLLYMEADSGVLDGGSGVDSLTPVVFDGATNDIVIDMRAAATAVGTTINGTLVRNVERSASYFATGAGNDTLIFDMPAGDFHWYAGLGDSTLVISLATATTAIHTIIDGLNIGDYELVTDDGDFDFEMNSARPIAGNRFDVTGGQGDDDLIGLNRNDVLKGGAGGDTLTGQAGDDLLDGGAGRDSMIGGKGNDTYYVDNPFDQVFEVLNQGADTVYTSASLTLGGTEIETVILTGTGNINVVANAGVTSIVGNSGDNSIDGGASGDTMAGAGGNDTYTVDDPFDRVIERAGEGVDMVYASISYEIGNSYVENAALTGSAYIYLTGNALDNWLGGNTGNNRIYGGLGADTLAGGAGDDTYAVENAADQVLELAGEGTDLVGSSISYTLTDNVENLTLTGDEHISGWGNAATNIIRGNYRDNALDGGSAGNDALLGGLGNDSYIVSHAGVTVVERTGEGHDTVYAFINFALGANLEDLNLDGTAANGKGNGLDNAIVGNASSNHLSGEGGNDTLSGEGGQDVFVFGLGSGADVITDFSVIDHDRINVNAYSHGTAGGGGITVTQSGLDVVIDLGTGNMITVLNSLSAAVYTHIFW